MNRFKLILVFVFIVAGISGYLLRGAITQIDDASDTLHPIRDQNTSYKFINPLLAYDLPKDINESQNLEDKLNGYINLKKATGELEKISVYVRPVKTGGWAGINENEKYEPASLFKVPLMTAYLKWAETDPAILKRLIQIIGTPSQSADSLPSESLKPGQKVTAEELIRHMIVDSDNLAFAALSKNINPTYLTEVFSDLGIDYPDNLDKNYGVSAKEYALFFRILYNATYLNREMSEKSLGLLAKTTFRDGIVAGIPSATEAAHKYGERVIRDGGEITSVELHDCGIVYHATNPYILCIMSRGNSPKGLAGIIAEISRKVFDVMSEDK